MHFTDHTLAKHFDQIENQLAAGASDSVLRITDEKRWSELPLERAKAAVSYCSLAQASMSNDNWKDAAFFWHFAGHGFRTVWMEAKAGNAYLCSAECGEKAAEVMEVEFAKKQRDFDLRSLGRARSCFTIAGQVWRLSNIDELINAAIERNK